MIQKVAISICLLGFSIHVSAETVSGPTEGTKLETLKTHITSGDDAGEMKDIAKLHQKGTTIYIFVQAELFSRPIARFMRELDTRVAADLKETQIVAVWLTDDIDMSKEYQPRAQNSIKLQSTTWTVWDGDKNGPGEWGINSDAYVTVIVAKDGVAVKSLGYQSINETVVPDIVKIAGLKTDEKKDE